MSKFKDTLYLPKTDYAMRANLKELEIKILEYWQEIDLYKLQQENEKPWYELMYGPPYANGLFHMGHLLNITLKCIYEVFAIWNNYRIKCKVGFDCHGLPVELAVKKNKEFVNESELINFYIHKQLKDINRFALLKEKDYYATYNESHAIYNLFSKLLLNNKVYLEKKPLFWSIKEQTVVADTEIEYKDIETNAVCVALQITYSPIEDMIGSYICIWTTTAWTLIDNVCVTFNKNLFYRVINCGEKIFYIEENLVGNFIEKIGEDYELLLRVPGLIFTDIKCVHPVLKTEVSLYHSDHVNNEDGTGFVHIAPAYGLDDFNIAKEHNLPMPQSVTFNGSYRNMDFGIYDFEKILNLLNGKIVYIEKIQHRYPHCSRTGPVIYYLSDQIFIKLEDDKEKITNILNKVNFTPHIFKEHLIDTIIKRKEWCVSRNRKWGVPLCLFIHKETGKLLINEELQEKILLFLEHNPHNKEFFFNESVYAFLLDVGLNPTDYEYYEGVLDVWFDSACVFYFINKEYGIADLYLEGKDQARGWFQSSFWVSYLLTGNVPYKEIVSHGFVTDGNGYKLSKSKGNVTDPQNLITNGVDILKLWVILSDYTDEVKVSEEIMERAGEVYRKIRNTLRYLTSICENKEYNLGFLELAMIDWLKKIIQINDIRKLFDEFFYYINYLSNVYFNARKDSLYCGGEKRSAAQYASFLILKSLCAISKLFIPCTSEELWQYMKFGKSVYLYNLNEVQDLLNKINTNNEYDKLMELEPILSEYRKKIEILKQSGKIKNNYDLHISISSETIKKYNIDNTLQQEICDILQCSAIYEYETNEVNIMNEQKCERCMKSIMINTESKDLCERCNIEINKINL